MLLLGMVKISFNAGDMTRHLMEILNLEFSDAEKVVRTLEGYIDGIKILGEKYYFRVVVDTFALEEEG